MFYLFKHFTFERQHIKLVVKMMFGKECKKSKCSTERIIFINFAYILKATFTAVSKTTDSKEQQQL